MYTLGWPGLLLLLPLPVIVYRMLSRAPRQEVALYVPFFNTLQSLSEGQERSTPHLFQLFCCIAVWILLVAAASRPQWLGDPVELKSIGRDLMIAVDISGSMAARDMLVDNIPVPRIDVVKGVVTDFIENRPSDRLGLILFASQAYIQSPLTFDRSTVGTLLEEAEIGIIEDSATAIGDAIGLSVLHLRRRPDNGRVLVLLTDGVNNAGLVSPQQAGQLARSENIRIYVIGMSPGSDKETSRFSSNLATRAAADLDEDSLTRIAQSTGGRYFRARNRDELQEAYSELDLLELIEQDAQVYRPVKELFFWPLGLALLLTYFFAASSIRRAALKLSF